MDSHPLAQHPACTSQGVGRNGRETSPNGAFALSPGHSWPGCHGKREIGFIPGSPGAKAPVSSPKCGKPPSVYLIRYSIYSFIVLNAGAPDLRRGRARPSNPHYSAYYGAVQAGGMGRRWNRPLTPLLPGLFDIPFEPTCGCAGRSGCRGLRC